MPILPPIVGAPYDNLSNVLNAVRARVNDDIKTLEALGGKILNNNSVFTQTVVNTAWRKLQDTGAERGYATFTGETIIPALPVVASLDPASQAWLSWQGFFDGASFFSAPALPASVGHPLKIWERVSGQNASFCDPPMEKILDGLPAWGKMARLRFWEWRQDAIWMPGSQVIEDLRIRHVAYLPDFLDGNEKQWFQQTVPIVRISDAFSWFIVAELVAARGDNDLAQLCIERGADALKRVFNLDVRADQRVNIRRRPTGGGRRSWF